LIGSSKAPVKVIEIPTGAGKTWIYGLIAKYFCSLGKSVTVIVPNENLRN
jgi:superfamily II DNA or RNA helicase